MDTQTATPNQNTFGRTVTYVPTDSYNTPGASTARVYFGGEWVGCLYPLTRSNKIHFVFFTQQAAQYNGWTTQAASLYLMAYDVDANIRSLALLFPPF